MNKTQQINLSYLLLALAFMFATQWFLGTQTVETIPYSQFKQLIKAQEIEDVVVTETQVRGKYRNPGAGVQYFRTRQVGADIGDELDAAGISYSGASDTNLLTNMVSWLFPLVVFFGLWLFVFRRIAQRQGLGGMMNVGKSKAKVYVETNTGVSFEDVAGVDEAKMELQEVVSFLQDKTKYEKLGAHVPKGILLVGPPGTGKTLLARAVAGEAKVPFYSISGSEFVEMFVGVGAARVRDLFEQARSTAPCIIFIDELDALGKARGSVGGIGGHDEKEQTLNQLLAELDGFDPRAGIVLLAATNRPEILDPALLRAGRFDRQVVVDRPDKIGRIAILKVHLKNITAASDVNAEEIAGITPGFTGADLANLVNEAAIVATRRGASSVTTDDFTAAVERIVAGSEQKSRLLNPQERERVAYHELGHALAAATIPGSDPVHKVSIIPRSIGALGYTLQRPTEDRFLITSSELRNRMVVLLAGRAAEDVVFGEISTGASDDLAKVTDIARQFVTQFGMDPTLGQAVLESARTTYLGNTGPGIGARDYAEATAREVDVAVRELIATAYERAKNILIDQRTTLDEGARLLLKQETLTPDEFPALKTVDAQSLNTADTPPQELSA